MASAEQFIYLVKCPSSGSPKYVGRSRFDPERRLRQHISKANRNLKKGKPDTAFHKWLTEIDRVPPVELLEVVPANDYSGQEQVWVDIFGYEQLLNSRKGDSVVTEYGELPDWLYRFLGKYSDRHIARRFGMCRETIGYNRRKAGIKRCEQYRRVSPPVLTTDDQPMWIQLPAWATELLGHVPDVLLAEQVGSNKTKIGRDRRRLGIKKYQGPLTSAIIRLKKRTDRSEEIEMMVVNGDECPSFRDDIYGYNLYMRYKGVLNG